MQELEDLELVFDAFAGCDGQTRVVGKQVARLVGDLVDEVGLDAIGRRADVGHQRQVAWLGRLDQIG